MQSQEKTIQHLDYVIDQGKRLDRRLLRMFMCFAIVYVSSRFFVDIFEVLKTIQNDPAQPAAVGVGILMGYHNVSRSQRFKKLIVRKHKDSTPIQNGSRKFNSFPKTVLDY